MMEFVRLQSAMSAMLAAQDVEELDRKIVDVLPDAIGFDRLALLSLPSMQQESQVLHELGNLHLDLSMIPRNSPLAPGGSIDGQQTGTADDDDKPHGNVCGTYVLAPLRERGRIVSLVYADTLREEMDIEGATAALAYALEAAGMVRANLTLALESQRLLSELEALSRTDTLTALPNRRAFEERMDEELHRSARSRRPFGLAIFDVDHFAEINDTYGPAAGDEALRQVADTLRGRARHVDYAARLAGDEFALLVLEADHKSARVIVERVLDAAKQAKLSVPVQLSVSAGVALSYPVDTTETLIERADAALCEAKLIGRDRAT